MFHLLLGTRRQSHYTHAINYRWCSFTNFFSPRSGQACIQYLYVSQASGKRRILTSFSVYPIYTTFSFNFFTSTPFVTQRSFIQLTRAKKPLSALMFDMYLTLASQSQLDNLCNGALMNSHTLRSSQISLLASGWPSSLRWFVSKRDQILQYQFFQGQRGTEWELNARNSCLSSRIFFCYSLYLCL